MNNHWINQLPIDKDAAIKAEQAADELRLKIQKEQEAKKAQEKKRLEELRKKRQEEQKRKHKQRNWNPNDIQLNSKGRKIGRPKKSNRLPESGPLKAVLSDEEYQEWQQVAAERQKCDEAKLIECALNKPVKFTVMGAPRPLPRPRFVGGQNGKPGRVISITNPVDRLWKDLVVRKAHAFVAANGNYTPFSKYHPISIKLRFYMPVHVYKTKPKFPRPNLPGCYHEQKPDIDNLAKMALDAITQAELIPDDCHIAELITQKLCVIRQRARMEVEISPLPFYPEEPLLDPLDIIQPNDALPKRFSLQAPGHWEKFKEAHGPKGIAMAQELDKNIKPIAFRKFNEAEHKPKWLSIPEDVQRKLDEIDRQAEEKFKKAQAAKAERETRKYKAKRSPEAKARCLANLAKGRATRKANLEKKKQQQQGYPAKPDEPRSGE